MNDRDSPVREENPPGNQENAVVCGLCGREGHRRRTHWNCRLNAANAPVPSEPTTPAVVRVCQHCGQEGHSRRNHRDCRMNPNNQNATPAPVAVPAPVICPHCGREGHSRRNHGNCGMNPHIQTDPIRHNRARDPTLPEVARNNVGAMDIICSQCQAHMWIGERKINSSLSSPMFQTCCAAGKAILRPVESYPDIIANLLRNNDEEANEFKQNIRTYNSALSFTSMNADLDHRYANEQHGAYAFRIHGGVYHLMSPTLIPDEANVIQQPRFAQIYIFDSQNELQNRMNVAGNQDVSRETMLLLQGMMHDDNPYVIYFKTMEELASEQEGGIQNIRMVFRAESAPDPRRYNAPTADEIGVLIVGGDDEGDLEPRNRDIVLQLKGHDNNNHLYRLNELNQHYDPLHYVLMFPKGDRGWNINIKSYNPNQMDIDPPVAENGQPFVPVINDPVDTQTNEAEISLMQYYSSRLMLRPNQDTPANMQISIHSFGKLFHQYVVDMYAKMEQQRLNFIRFNQKALRAEVYSGLSDAIRLDDSDMSSVGKRVILPSSFIGGPRFMAQLFQDAMNLVRRFGKPDLFITFTCNPAWPEIQDELLVNQRPSDRPDLCARIFRQKLRAFLQDVVKESVLGKVVAYCYTIEFQKRGLPHCHMLFILAEEDKPRTAEQINNIVSAEIPDPATNPLAYETITTSMVHGPCGDLNPQSVCMKNGICTKRYPHPFAETTTLAEDSEDNKLTYRRRFMPDRVVMRNNGRTTVDNRWIVPHNLYLAAKYNAHINVEICNEIHSIKYVYKYVYKGHDRAQVGMGTVGAPANQDEVSNFLDARYVSASEACWRLLSYEMHKEFPACQRMDIHLPDSQMVYFTPDDQPSAVLGRGSRDTTLTAWFTYNRDHPNDEDAQALIYPDFCERFTYHKTPQARFWAARQRGFGGIIGRMYTVSPRDIEKYHLRLLLLNVAGATSFHDIRTIDGVLYSTFQGAARALGLLADDTEWSAAMTEAALTQHPSALRQLFCILVAFSGLSDAFQLWLDHRDSMAEDYLYRYQQDPRNARSLLHQISEEMYSHCLLDLNDILADHRFDLREMEGFRAVFPAVDTRQNQTNHSNTYARLHEQLYMDSLDAQDPDLLPFNESQRAVYNAVKEAAFRENTQGPRIFFVDGPGGTGKTFVFNALLDCVRQENEIAIAVASSGTAALLLKGGRTAHSTFKIPLEVNNNTMCDMSPRSVIASFIKRAKLIVWDECSMISKDLIATVDRSFRDITKVDAPFGGCLMVFGGDFRQVLPIIKKASRSVIVGQCLNKASFWSQVVKMQLHTNMRVQQALRSNDQRLADELQHFASFLLRVGQGDIPTLTLPGNMPSDFIQIPQDMIIPGDNLLHLIRSVFFDILSHVSDPVYFAERAILTAKNKDVGAINNLLLDCVPNRKVTYVSVDSPLEDETQMPMPVEVLNTVESGSLPPHILDLKVGVPIMVIRNIDPAAGVCNGTRLIVTSLGTNVLEALIATGPKAGNVVLIPKIKFITMATEGICPFDFVRVQFPVRLAFGMTINKAQGQTLGSVGLYLPGHVFGHGQLYVALSRVRTPTSIKIMIPDGISKIENHTGSYTHNVVFKEVFNVPNN